MKRLVCLFGQIFASFSVPPLIDHLVEYEGKQCLHIKMRLSLTLGDSEFLISNSNVSGNCSTVELGWPDKPFPEIGRIRMEFQLEKNTDGIETTGLRLLEVTIREIDYQTSINDQYVGAPLGQSFMCNTGFKYRLCPSSNVRCRLGAEAATLQFTAVRFQLL